MAVGFGAKRENIEPFRAAVNAYADDKLSVDVSQYEAFGRYYHAYVMARSLDGDDAYLKEMEKEKAGISWKKILDVISVLEEDLKRR